MKNKSVLFIIGALCNLAFAPFDFLPVLLVAFPLFLIYLDKAETNKQAFWCGWWFGFGYFVCGIYWISNSLLVDAEKFAWLIPFAIAGLPSILAVYIGIVGWGYRKISIKLDLGPIAKVFLFINLWVALEFVRSAIFSGFPWNLIGYSAFFSMELAQLGALGGIYFLSWFMLLISLSPMFWKHDRTFFYGVVALLLAAFTYVVYKDTTQQLAIIDNKEVHEVYNIRVIQPNIEQKLKWDDAVREKNYNDVLGLAMQGDKDKFDAIIMPESAVTYHLNRDEIALKALGQAVPKGGVIVTGSVRSQGVYPKTFKIWNSLYVVNDKAQIDAIYDKHHLVPFGEFVPMRDVLPIDKITHGSVDFSNGELIGSMPLNKAVPNSLRFNPLICYEIIFPNYGRSKENYDFILNVTNDAWFGESSGPYQHLAMAKMRAIEQGKPVIRAANTGVSAYINKKGEVVDSIDLNETGVMDIELRKDSTEATLYSGYQNFLVLLLMILTMLSVIFMRKKLK